MMRPLLLTLAILTAPSFLWASDECSEYQVGETRKLEKGAILGALLPTPTHSYAVTRVAEDKFRLAINPIFYLPSKNIYDNFSGPENYQIDNTARFQMDLCFSWYNRTYGNERTPQIELATTNQVKSISIQIKKDDKFRSHSRHYSEKDLKSCVVVIHEALHLMGLRDEYLETGSQKEKYNCRSISDSIMGYTFAYEEKPFDRAESILCGCLKKDDPACKAEVSTRDYEHFLKGCPAGSTELVRGNYNASFFDIYMEINLGKKPYKGVQYGRAASIHYEIPRTPLRPAHIRQLLYPQCKSKNQLYRKCIANAYVTRKNKDTCPATPPECGEYNTWLE